MGRKVGGTNSIKNVRWDRTGAKPRFCDTCGKQIRHSGFEHYCSRECYRAMFRRSHK